VLRTDCRFVWCGHGEPQIFFGQAEPAAVRLALVAFS